MCPHCWWKNHGVKRVHRDGVWASCVFQGVLGTLEQMQKSRPLLGEVNTQVIKQSIFMLTIRAWKEKPGPSPDSYQYPPTPVSVLNSLDTKSPISSGWWAPEFITGACFPATSYACERWSWPRKAVDSKAASWLCFRLFSTTWHYASKCVEIGVKMNIWKLW